jgi:hypothetical protein
MVVAVAAARGVDAPLTLPLDAHGVRAVLWTGGAAGAFVLYLAAIALLRRRTARVWIVVAIAAAIQLVPLAAPLLMSRDAYAYWDYGEVAARGGNPYQQPPDEHPDVPAFRVMGSDWYRTRDTYGPAWTLASEGAARTVGDSARSEARFFKLLAAAGMLALTAAAAFAARRRAMAAAFVGWNPLLALHFGGGGHNDVWMLALAVAGTGFASRGRGWAAAAAWTVSTAVKFVTLVFVPLEAARLRRRFPWLALAVSAAAAAAVASALYGWWWIRALAPISNQLQAESAIGAPHRLAQLGVPLHWAQVALVALFILGYAWLLREAWRGRPRRSLAAGGVCLATSWLTPWYLAWPLAYAAVDDDDAATVLALLLSAYGLLASVPH